MYKKRMIPYEKKRKKELNFQLIANLWYSKIYFCLFIVILVYFLRNIDIPTLLISRDVYSRYLSTNYVCYILDIILCTFTKCSALDANVDI